MVASAAESSVQTLSIHKEIDIAAPINVAWEALLLEITSESEMPGGQPFPFKLEAWPGGRWFRDLGDGSGHLWGHVQVIKPPALLELCGPMFMSFPSANHIKYRLAAEGDRTRLTLTHQAMGPIPTDIQMNVGSGWEYGLNRIVKIAERLQSQKQKENKR